MTRDYGNDDYDDDDKEEAKQYDTTRLHLVPSELAAGKVMYDVSLAFFVKWFFDSNLFADFMRTLS